MTPHQITGLLFGFIGIFTILMGWVKIRKELRKTPKLRMPGDVISSIDWNHYYKDMTTLTDENVNELKKELKKQVLNQIGNPICLTGIEEGKSIYSMGMPDCITKDGLEIYDATDVPVVVIPAEPKKPTEPRKP